MHITWYEVLINIAAFVVLMIPVYFSRMTNGEKWTTGIVGIIILSCSIWKGESDSEKQDNLTDSISSIHKTVISLPDSIKITNKAISELGLKVDENTGLLKVIDSQLLKKKFFQIIDNIQQPISPLPTNNSSGDIQKINKAFYDLGINGYQRDISLNYIIQNFPPNIADNQINQIIKDYPFFQSHEDQYNQIKYLLTTQGKKQIVIDFFKTILLKNGADKILWDYVYKYDKNLTFDYIVGTIKPNPPYWMRYSDAIRFSMGVNNNICKQLLNSNELIEFVITRCSDDELIWCKNAIKSTIENKHTYSDYKTTYFVQKYLKNM